MEILDIGNIAAEIPYLSENWVKTLAEACTVCLARSEHKNNIVLNVTGDQDNIYQLIWSENIYSDVLDRTWRDQHIATELGAECISIILAKKQTDYTVIDRSVRNDGFDYWLGHEDDNVFLKMARLEISGIYKGEKSQINARVKQKKEQTKQSDTSGLPAYISIIEFSKPLAYFEERNVRNN